MKTIQVRTTKEDSAFFYHLMEGHEGLCAYSTLPDQTGKEFRDLELLVSPDREGELLTLLADWDFVQILAK